MGADLDTDGYTQAQHRRFQAVNARVLGIEGGFADHLADRGGTTKYGISLRFAKSLGHVDVNRDGFADLDLNFDTVIDGHDIALITPEIATGLYFKHFWLGSGAYLLPQPFDAAVYDQAVNAGTTSAYKLLQRALNSVFITYFGLEPLKVDGICGPATRGRLKLAVEKGLSDETLAAYRRHAVDRYREIAAADPIQNVFLKGWLNRAAELGCV